MGGLHFSISFATKEEIVFTKIPHKNSLLFLENIHSQASRCGDKVAGVKLKRQDQLVQDALNHLLRKTGPANWRALCFSACWNLSEHKVWQDRYELLCLREVSGVGHQIKGQCK